MFRIVVAAALLILAASCAHRASPRLRPDDETQIRVVVAEYANAWNAHDMEAWGRLFTEDVDYVNRNGGWWKNNEENLAGHRPLHAAMERNGMTMDFAATLEKVELLAPGVALAHVSTRWPGLGAASGRGEGMITAVLVKRDGRWLIRALHNTLKAAG